MLPHLASASLDALAANEPLARRDRRHLDTCLACRESALGRGISTSAIAAALAKPTGPRLPTLAAAGLATTIACAAFAFTPLRAAASAFLSTFEPLRVAAVPLTAADLRSLSTLPDISTYARTRELRRSATAAFADARSAGAAAGFALRVPTNVPAGTRAVVYNVNGPSSQVFTFRQTAGVNGRPGLPLPSDIAGRSLRIDLGSVLLAVYESTATAADAQRIKTAVGQLTAATNAPAVERRAAGATRDAHTPRQNTFFVSYSGNVTRVRRAPASGSTFTVVRDGMPLIVAQMPVPHLVSTVPVGRLAAYMLSQPGISPHLAAAFGALGDLSQVVPIPVPVDKAYSQPVIVDGVVGVGIGDDTGLGAAVIWQKNGMLYAVCASRSAHDVLAIANSLR